MVSLDPNRWDRSWTSGLSASAGVPSRASILIESMRLRGRASRVVGRPLSAWAVDQSLNGPSDSISHAWIYA